MQKVSSFITAHKRLVVAALLVTLIFCMYQFYPLKLAVGWSLMYVLPGSTLAFLVASWLVTAMMGAAMAIVYKIADVKNSILAALVGFALNFLVVSLLAVLMDMAAWQEVIGGAVISFAVFLAIPVLLKKVTISPVFAVIAGSLLLGGCVYGVPLLTQPISVQKYVDKKTDTFERATSSLDFTPFYPTFQSGQYPATPPMLNGYSGEKYAKKSVTFLLGQAQVRQSARLKNQEQVMNFVDNCDSFRLWFTLTDDDSISQHNIDASKKSPQKCEMIHETPSGDKVYFNDRGRIVLFYMQLDQTNFIIRFDDDIKGGKYDPRSLPEILHILDSLKPLDKAKLQKGSSFGDGFSS